AHEPASGRSMREIARRSYEVVFRFAEEHEDEFLILFRERRSEDPQVQRYLQEENERFVAQLAQDYQRIIDAGAAPQIDVHLGAELIAAMTMATLLRYFENRDLGRERLIDGLIRVTLGGLPALAREKA
ncbi:MAG: hypothetical protein ACRD1Z_11360, partial [Vicinamibacteria bacterium]